MLILFLEIGLSLISFVVFLGLAWWHIERISEDVARRVQLPRPEQLPDAVDKP